MQSINERGSGILLHITSLPGKYGIGDLGKEAYEFIDYLRDKRILGIDMELATLFSVAYHYAVPIGSIMLVSDMPLQRSGIKDKKKQNKVFSNYMEPHLDLALDAVKNIDAKWSEVKRRLNSEW